MKKNNKKIFGDYGTNNTFTLYEMRDNSGNKQFRIGTTDDMGDPFAFLLLPIILPIYLGMMIYYFVKYRVLKK